MYICYDYYVDKVLSQNLIEKIWNTLYGTMNILLEAYWTTFETHLDVEMGNIQGMQEGYPIQNLLQQSGNLSFFWNFVSVQYHL